jgi:hypothetical protein
VHQTLTQQYTAHTSHPISLALLQSLSCCGRYIKFNAWFVKNVLFDQKKIKLSSKWYVEENKTEMIQHVLTTQ